MEALRTKIDSLQWEVNRLDAENQKLRAQDQEACEKVDLQAELERAQGDVAGLEEQLKQQVTRGEKTVAEAQQRVAQIFFFLGPLST